MAIGSRFSFLHAEGRGLVRFWDCPSFRVKGAAEGDSPIFVASCHKHRDSPRFSANRHRFQGKPSAENTDLSPYRPQVGA
jgi:hypothetical protein